MNKILTKIGISALCFSLIACDSDDEVVIGSPNNGGENGGDTNNGDTNNGDETVDFAPDALSDGTGSRTFANGTNTAGFVAEDVNATFNITGNQLLFTNLDDGQDFENLVFTYTKTSATTARIDYTSNDSALTGVIELEFTSSTQASAVDTFDFNDPQDPFAGNFTSTYIFGQ